MKLKEIVGYLPYELEIKIYYRNQPFYTAHLAPSFLRDLSGVFPVLHPLSDLTKEIVVEGYNEDKPFVPIEKINVDGDENIDESGDMYYADGLDSIRLGYGTIRIIQLFYQWHFDIHGLIEKGEAIDINALAKGE